MNRKEALEHYKLNQAKSLIEECEKNFNINLRDNEEKIKAMLIEGIKSVDKKAKKVQELHDDYRLYVLQFEFLRTNIINETYKILIHGYNGLWYLDDNSVYEEIDLLFIFEPFIILKEKLLKAKKSYLGKVNNYDIQEIIFNLASKCYNQMCDNSRIWMWNLDEEEWIKESSLWDAYLIKWGEYQSKSETIFSMDNREKKVEDILEFKKKPKEKMPFVYSVWKDSILKDADLSEEDLLFINFKNSKLINMDFTKSNIIKGQFKNTEVVNCRFNHSLLVGSSFENAIIKETSFESSNLTNLDFRKATFNKVSFENAIVEGAIFSENQIPFLHLTPEQLQDIYIEGGE
ncbi:pentapeptide repeat-containing protein [Clostridium sp.]|uniref:pentapeptide repeat-containing protein n=1 Tax=Clostridium sp. TaxID=1506 RepID=UPI003463D429